MKWDRTNKFSLKVNYYGVLQKIIVSWSCQLTSCRLSPVRKLNKSKWWTVILDSMWSVVGTCSGSEAPVLCRRVSPSFQPLTMIALLLCFFVDLVCVYPTCGLTFLLLAFGLNPEDTCKPIIICPVAHIAYLYELYLFMFCIGLAQWLLLTPKFPSFGPRAAGFDRGRCPMFYPYSLNASVKLLNW